MRIFFSIVLSWCVAGCSVVPVQSSAPSEAAAAAAEDQSSTTQMEPDANGIQVTVLEEENLGPGTLLDQPTNPAVATLRKDAQLAVLDGRYDAAVIALERAVRIAPRDPSIWLQLAKIKYTQGDYAQARELAEKSKQLAGMDGQIRAEADLVIRRAR